MYEKKIFALVGYKRNNQILIDLALKNGSDIQLFDIKVKLFDRNSGRGKGNTDSTAQARTV